MSLAKKQKKGVLLPPAVGYSLKIMAGLFARNQVSARYYPRLVIITLINLINWPFRTWERLLINPGFKNEAIKNDPVFIVGHWRSGTTHLHNLLCQDERLGFVTTYQSVFPDTLLAGLGRFIFGGFTKLLIPGPAKATMLSWIPPIRRKKNLHLATKLLFAFTISGCSPKISGIITIVSSGFGEFRIHNFNPGKTITNC